jgi:hypothetical protein
MTASEGPILTVLVQGRNDSYMGNFLWRLSTCINKHAENVFRLQARDTVELVLTDWGSGNDSRLDQALTLSEEAKQLLKTIHVVPETAAKYNRDSPYSWVHAVNTGARRCRGKFILFCDSDGYFPLESLQRLLEGISRNRLGEYALGETFFVGSRFHIPARFHASGPSLAEIDNFIQGNHASFEHDKIKLQFFSGNAAAYFWSKQIWEECRGFDERLIHWGWYDIDLFIRLASKYRAADLEDLGILTYHLEHYSDKKQRITQTEMPRKWNNTAPPKVYASNPADWGLIREPLQISQWSFHPAPPTATLPSPDAGDELYFALHKLARFIYLMTVTIDRHAPHDDKLANELVELNRIKAEILEVTNNWVARKSSFDQPDSLMPIQTLHDRGRTTMVRIFKDERFQTVFGQIIPT